MKILLDACVWGKAKERLAQEGHDVVWAGDWQEDPGDLEILKRAHITQMEEGSPPAARKMEGKSDGSRKIAYG